MNKDKFDTFFITLFVTIAIITIIIAIVESVLLVGFTIHYLSTKEVNTEIQIIDNVVIETKEMTDWLHSWTESKILGYAAALP